MQYADTSIFSIIQLFTQPYCKRPYYEILKILKQLANIFTFRVNSPISIIKTMKKRTHKTAFWGTPKSTS